MDTDCMIVFRSNFFEVTDMKAFDSICAQYRLQKRHDDSNTRLVGFLKIITDENILRNHEEHDEDRIINEISKILKEDQVCIVFEVGYFNNEEFVHFVNGSCAAIDSNSKQIQFCLSDIYGKVMNEFGTASMTLCQD